MEMKDILTNRIGLADITAEYILNHTIGRIGIDLGEGDFIIFHHWTEPIKTVILKQNFNNGTIVNEIKIENPTEEQVKEILLERIGVNEDELD